MTPEQRSRLEIDRHLLQCGWVVQSSRDMNISANLGVAVREFPLKSGLANYLLYTDCKALGVIEAKPEGHNLTGVETQSTKYLDGLPNGLWSKNLVEKTANEIERNGNRAAPIRQSILKRAFEGKLVPQDPTDEPAAKLPDHIRQERESSDIQESKTGSARRRTRGNAKGPTKRKE